MSDVFYAAIMHGKEPGRFLPGKGKRFKGGTRTDPQINFSINKNRNRDIFGVHDTDIILDDPFMLKLFNSKTFSVADRELMFEFEKNDDGKFVATGLPFSESAGAWIDDICYLHAFDDFSPAEMLVLDFRSSVGAYRKETLEGFNFKIGFHSYYSDQTQPAHFKGTEELSLEDRTKWSEKSFFDFWQSAMAPEVWKGISTKDLYIYSATKPELSLYHMAMKANPVISPKWEDEMLKTSFHNMVHWYKMSVEYHPARVPILDKLIGEIRTANTRFSKFVNNNIIDIMNLWNKLDHSQNNDGKIGSSPYTWFGSYCYYNEPFIETLIKSFMQ
jgi:hypothetical protein